MTFNTTQKVLALLFSLALPIHIFAQVAIPTMELNERESAIFTTEKKAVYTLDVESIKAELEDTPNWKKADIQDWSNFSITLSDGRRKEIKIAEAPIAQKALYKLYPENTTYKVASTNNNEILSGRLALSPKGLSGLILFEDQQLYIEALGDGRHITYQGGGEMVKAFECNVDNAIHDLREKNANIQRSLNGSSNGSQMREYVIAIAATGEFSSARGDNLSVINADINTYLTAVNALYESELAITFALTANNNNVVFFDPNSDPFNPSNKIPTAVSGITVNLSNSEYDLGHVFSTVGSGGSGVAYVGAVCRIQGANVVKAGGWTQASTSISLFAYTSLWGHEIGHQLGAPHSFYGTAGNCQNRSPGDGYEPGSGNSIMSYEGICSSTSGTCPGDHNITPTVSTNYLHASSIENILTYISGQSCATTSPTGNGIPTVTVPNMSYIPKETPFELTATGNDPDGDPLTYTWEQYDTDGSSVTCANGHPNQAATSTTAPLFRSFQPSLSASRSFPSKNDLSANTQTMGEILPEVGRTLHMRVTARDNNPNGGAIVCQDVTVEVVNTSGPFRVTTANSGSSYTEGQNINVTWDVVGTNQSPINCNQVNIKWSNDGGNSFPISLASGVSNDGSQSVTLPFVGTTTGRLRVESVGNVFFDINDSDIVISSSCTPPVAEIIGVNPITADEGDLILDLDLLLGKAINSLSGSVESADPNVDLTVNNNGNCFDYNFGVNYESHQILFSSTESISANSNATWVDIMNLYQPNLNVSNNCQNWIASSGNGAGGGVTHSNVLLADVTANVPYEFVIHDFPGQANGAYTISFSGGGQMYDLDFLTTGFTSTFVVSNNSGTIKDIIVDPDLSDPVQFPGDTYTVQGLIYNNSINLNSYVNGPVSTLNNDLSNGTICGLYTPNSLTVTIVGGPCIPSTKMVLTGLDDGSSSCLRTIVNNSCPGDSILFNVGVNTVIISSELSILQECMVQGNGQVITTFDGMNTNRIFSVGNASTLVLKGITLKNTNEASNGGAIWVQPGSTLILEDCAFEDNKENGQVKAMSNDGNVQIVGGTVNIKQ